MCLVSKRLAKSSLSLPDISGFFMDNAITTEELGIIEKNGFTFTPNGVYSDSEPSLEKWIPAWEFAKKSEGAVQFWIGDLLNYGLDEIGENEISQYLDGKNYHTHSKYAYTCKRIPKIRRRITLGYSIHEEIAYLDENG